MDADAAGPELGSVAHQIICGSPHRCRVRLEQVHVVDVGHHERVVARSQHSVLFIEDREVGDPEPCVLLLRLEFEDRDGCHAGCCQRRRRDVIGACGDQHEIAGFQAHGDRVLRPQELP